ncbi:MAG: IS200/IS605 family transposase [Candidatus Omnitrophota bacterium]
MEVIRSYQCVYNIHYHFVFPVKYRKALLDKRVSKYFVEICKGIKERYEIDFERVGIAGDHVHILCSGVPRYSPTRMITAIKSITAREIFRKFPEVKKELWGGEFWTDGYYVATVGEGGNKEVIERYIEKQGNTPKEVQLELFDI